MIYGYSDFVLTKADAILEPKCHYVTPHLDKSSQSNVSSLD